MTKIGCKKPQPGKQLRSGPGSAVSEAKSKKMLATSRLKRVGPAAPTPTVKKSLTVRRVPSIKKVLDKLFSEIIRRRAMQRVGGCERCLTRKTDFKELQCSHIIGRSNYKVRWDLDDAFGLCGGCHMLLEHNPVEHAAFAQEKLGSRYDLLRIRSVTRQKVDFELIHLFLKEEIKKYLTK